MTMTEPRRVPALEPVDWQGVHHLALITNDMDATVRFWHGVLGADLVATIRTGSFLHYFFRVSSTCSVAFFQYEDNATELVKPAGVFDKKACQFDHLALNVADEAELEKLRLRLLEADCEATDIVDHRIMKSVYFTDPNGIALEASCWVNDPTDDLPSYDDPEFFGDPDPVPAVREIIDGGLQSLVRTTLV